MCEYLIISGILLSILFSLLFIYQVMKFPSGNAKMNNVANIIQSCARLYLKLQYRIIFFVGLIISIFIYLFLGKLYVIGFLIGAVLSSIVGYIGMLVSVYANVRTSNAIRINGLAKGLEIAFKAGSIVGLLVIGFSLFSIYLFYYILTLLNIETRIILNSLTALGLGASLISIFARLGGGIFTKGADIGADLVGKIEIGIPEDDYRNPAVIADNIGDNVGDCAGMAADLFETYCVTMIATMLLIGILSSNLTKVLILYPLLVGSACVFSTIIGMFFVRLGSKGVMYSLYKGFFITAIMSGIIIYFVTSYFLGLNNIYIFGSDSISGISFYYCSLCGIAITIILVLVTEYYTSTKYKPVRDIAKYSSYGHATNIIQGLAISMEATALPVLFISICILLSYNFAGIIGISIAATSMLSLSGIIVALDAYGPIVDNAGGIAVMTGLDETVRKNTDVLDAVGNTTKAITKGYAIGSAGLASLVLFIAYTEDVNYYFPMYKLFFSLKDPFVVVGLFFGASIPYLFSSFALKSVGNVAGKVLIEVRRQFKEIKGIISGEGKPDYHAVINLLTTEALREMIIPSLLPVISPLILYFVIFLLFGEISAFTALGAMLLGIIITGMFVAISMTSGGGAWDNAKKYIEDGNYGGKNSLSHRSAITGDMVGDPYKDTAGPAINPLIKVVNIVSLLLVIAISKFN